MPMVPRRYCLERFSMRMMGFRVSGCRFQVAGFRLQVSGCRLQVAGFRSERATYCWDSELLVMLLERRLANGILKELDLY